MMAHPATKNGGNVGSNVGQMSIATSSTENPPLQPRVLCRGFFSVWGCRGRGRRPFPEGKESPGGLAEFPSSKLPVGGVPINAVPFHDSRMSVENPGNHVGPDAMSVILTYDQEPNLRDDFVYLGLVL